MARAAFLCVPFTGHINPTLPIVRELVRRGEAVDYYATEEHRTAIEHAGARFRAMPETATSMMRSFDINGSIFYFSEFLARLTLEMLPEVRETFQRERPDYIVYDTSAAWARLAAEQLGIPAVSTFPTFGALPEKSPLPPIPILLAITGARQLAASLRHLRGRAEVAREIAQRFGGKELCFAHTITNPAECNIVFTAEAFQKGVAVVDDRFHFVGASIAERPPDRDFPIDRLKDRRVVYISVGSTFKVEPSFFRPFIEAFGGSDDVLVVSVGKQFEVAALGRTPDNCIVRPFVPQLEVLRHASLFVTHGGMNSVMEGLYFDVPLLVNPLGADQYYILRQVKKLGIGRRVNKSDLEPARLRRIMNEMMADEAMRRRVEEVGGALRAAGGVQRATEIILEFRAARCAKRTVVTTSSQPPRDATG